MEQNGRDRGGWARRGLTVTNGSGKGNGRSDTKETPSVDPIMQAAESSPYFTGKWALRCRAPMSTRRSASPSLSQAPSRLPHLAEPGRHFANNSVMLPQIEQSDQQDSSTPALEFTPTLPAPPRNLQDPSVPHPLFLLPEPDPLYTGRDEEAEHVLLDMLPHFEDPEHCSPRAICVAGSTGIGRLTFSLDLGGRIRRAGACPAGSRLIDLRDVRSMESALGRLCGALDMSMDEHAPRRIPARLAAFALTYGGPMLLLLANVEGVTSSPDGNRFQGFMVQMAMEAILLVTSTTPVIERFKQHMLHGLSNAAGQQLLQRIAPNITPVSAHEAVQLCLGMPLLIRLIGEALASHRLSIQDVRDSAVPPDEDQTVATVNLALRALTQQQHVYLEHLAVFPSPFDDDGAEAVLDMEKTKASDVLGLLGKQGLVSRDITNGVYSLHRAVRAQLLESASSETKRVSQTRFSAHTLKILDLLAAKYYSKSWKEPLSLTREHAANLTAAFELAGKLIRNSKDDSPDLLPQILKIDSEIASVLLDAAGIRRGTWVHLQDAHEHCQGQPMLLAAALYIQHLSLGHKEAFDAAAKAFELRKEALGQLSPLTASCLFAMADSLRRQFRYEDAEPLFREAVELRKEAVGKDARTHDYLRHLGWCLFDFGHHDPARSFDQDAVDGLKELLGSEHPSTLMAMNDLAVDEEDNAVSEAQFRATYEAELRVLGIDHPNTLSTMHNLAIGLNNLGKHTEAHSLYDIIIPWRFKVLGPNSSLVFDSVSGLASCLDSLGDSQAAGDKHLEAICGQRQTAGHHPHTFSALHKYALFLEKNGRCVEAEKLYQEVLEGRLDILGNKHIDTLRALKCKADCLKKQGHLVPAEQLYRDVMQRFMDVFGPFHKSTSAVMEDLAACLEEMGHQEAATKLYEDALDLKQKRQPLHPNTLTSMSNLAIRLKNEGKLPKAEELYRSTVAGRREAFGSDHADTVLALQNMAVFFWNEDRHSEAGSVYREILTWRQKNLGSEHKDTLDAMDSLAYCLRQEGKFAEAEPLCGDLVKLQKQILGLQHEGTISALNGLSICLVEQGKNEAAMQVDQEVLEARIKVYGPEDLQTLTLMNNCAVSLATAGNSSKAEELYRGVVSGRRKVIGPDSADTMKAVRNLAIFYWNQDRFSEAESPFRELLAWHQKAAGAQHQDTLGTIDKLAFCLEVEGNNAEARALRMQIDAVK